MGRSGPECRWRRGRRAHPAASRAQVRMEGCGGEWFGVPVPRLFLYVGALHPNCRHYTSCQVLGFVEACLGRFLSCCCVLVFCLLRCDAAQGEVGAAGVVPVDPGGGCAFNLAPIAPWAGVAGARLVVDEFSFVQGVQRFGQGVIVGVTG